MQFIFVEFWLTLEFILYGFNKGHWHVVFGTEVKQTDCSFQFDKYFSETEEELIMQVLRFEVLKF